MLVKAELLDVEGGKVTAPPVCTTGNLELFAGEFTIDPWLIENGWPEPQRFTQWLPEGMPLPRTASGASWVIVPALQALLAELNTVAPDRDKRSDGGIGDQSHASGSSGHNPDESGNSEDEDADRINEVRARDFDRDLRRAGLTMEMVVQYLVQACRAGRIRWIKYMIFNRRIWSASSNFITRVYNGANSHSEHLHVSCKPDTASENSTQKVGLASLVEEDLVTSQAEFNKFMDNYFTTDNGKKLMADIVWNHVAGTASTKLRWPNTPNQSMKNYVMLAAMGGKDAVAVITKGLAEEVARDTQESVRDMALATTITALSKALDNATGSKLDPEQFQQLLQTISEKIVEAGQDATDAAAQRIEAIADALDNAGAALQTANDTPPQA